MIMTSCTDIISHSMFSSCNCFSQRYNYLVLQTNKEPSEVAISLDEETLQREYNGALQPVMTGSLSNLIAKTFKVITRKKVFVPGKFTNSNQQECVKCALR